MFSLVTQYEFGKGFSIFGLKVYEIWPINTVLDGFGSLCLVSHDQAIVGIGGISLHDIVKRVERHKFAIHDQPTDGARKLLERYKL